MLLPEEYKLFLQVFGVGYLGDDIAIYLPNDESFNHYLQPNLKPHNDIAYFGYIRERHLLFWDLSTYSNLDKSYDIYLTVITRNSYYDKVSYKIGRNFYHFVRDFCLGNSFYELLPKSEYVDPQIFVHTFFQIQSDYSQYLAFEKQWRDRPEQNLEQRKLRLSQGKRI